MIIRQQLLWLLSRQQSNSDLVLMHARLPFRQPCSLSHDDDLFWLFCLLDAVFPPQVGELPLYDIIDDSDLLVVMDECRLHRVDRDLLEVSEGEVVLLRGDGHLTCQVRIAHEPVVRAKEHSEAVLEEEREGMLLIALGGTRTHVACQAHLHRDAPVQDEL